MILLGFILFFLVLFYFYSNRKIYFLSWKLSGPPALPIIGNGLTFFCKDSELLDRSTEICRKYPSPFRLWFGPKFSMVISEVEQAQKIMSSYNFTTKDRDVYRFVEEFNGKGLITASGLKWKTDRRLISPKLARRNILQYFQPILDQTKLLTKILSKQLNQPTFDIGHYIHKCSVDIVNATILGVTTRAQFGELDELCNIVKRLYIIVHARIVKVWLQNDMLFQLSPYWKEHEHGKKVFYEFIDQVIDNKSINTRLYVPIIDQLREMSDEKTGFCNRNDLRDHLTTLFAASEDTVSSIASFTLVLLGMYPEIQEKIVREIYEIVGDEKHEIKESHLEKFVYFDMVIKEVMRLFPIASFIVRKSEREFDLEGYLIPEKCSVIISIFNIHRDKRYWEKPDEFYPEHFLPEATKTRHPYAYMPFSAGPRSCIGKPFAVMALKIILVTILQNFEMKSIGKLEDIKLKTDISVRPKDECFPVQIRKRQFFG
ncbi:unnamed protein product [Diabrotica balteata]|uniref:Cytochrome P450 n=1 Tax=Diabrotica balteata TaxID=107213 RepID=A0A9P0GZJ1_DIABA|nr:unnamed protein product [Diabrotica balteata]